jgi:hypothetical protein
MEVLRATRVLFAAGCNGQRQKHAKSPVSGRRAAG